MIPILTLIYHGVNYPLSFGHSILGLHDDEVAKLWMAFITHDHFDGIREWKQTKCGTPLSE